MVILWMVLSALLLVSGIGLSLRKGENRYCASCRRRNKNPCQPSSDGWPSVSPFRSRRFSLVVWVRSSLRRAIR